MYTALSRISAALNLWELRRCDGQCPYCKGLVNFDIGDILTKSCTWSFVCHNDAHNAGGTTDTAPLSFRGRWWDHQLNYTVVLSHRWYDNKHTGRNGIWGTARRQHGRDALSCCVSLLSIGQCDSRFLGSVHVSKTPCWLPVIPPSTSPKYLTDFDKTRHDRPTLNFVEFSHYFS